ncbi:hypothetical protein [Tsuneonella mangrovi]|uniref:hypothetical protein n=1 Tax=Tsuneonella mangrovi TaxID=1982042 RepID=UPI0012375649|nr:hypothetical protein [Tsuneonella mangrovi]
MITGNVGAGASQGLAPADDSGPALNAKLAALAASGGGTLQLGDGVYGTRVPIILPGGVTIAGTGKTIVRAIAPIGNDALKRSLVETPDGQTGCGIRDLTLDCAGNVAMAAWNATAPDTLTCDGVTIIGWKYGLYFVSSDTRPAQNISITNTTVRDGAGVQIYPIFVSSTIGGQAVRNVSMDGVTVLGTGGSYSAENAATADQIAFQNVQGFSLANIVSRNGGENGISIVRGSRDGTMRNVTVTGSDGHGLQIGGGGVVATVDNPAAFQADTPSLGMTSHGEAKVLRVVGNQVWLGGIKRHQLQVGERLLGAFGGAKITALEFCRNISLDGYVADGNGLNRAGIRGAFADLYISQAEDISLAGLDLRSPAPTYPLLVNNSRDVPCTVSTAQGRIEARRTGTVTCA